MIRALLVGLLLAAPAAAAPIAMVVSGDGVTMVLTDEPCSLKTVSNLSRRATWNQSGKKHEGCYAVSGGLVVTYWDDGSILIVEARYFRRVEGA